MLPADTTRVICSALGIASLDEVFQDFDMAKPLGAATIAQVCAATPHACSTRSHLLGVPESTLMQRHAPSATMPVFYDPSAGSFSCW